MAAAPDTSWRDNMTREDRIKVCQHIMQKLSTYYQMVPENALREKTSAFESQAYTHAESRTDYLRRIAGGLSNVERQVTQGAANTNNPGAGGGGGGGAPPGPGGNPPPPAAVANPSATASTTTAAARQAAAVAAAAAAAAAQTTGQRARSRHGSESTKIPNQRTVSSSSSVAGGGAGSKKTPSQADLTRANSFNGLQVPGMGLGAGAGDLPPEMLLGAIPQNASSQQQSRIAIQQAAAAAAARQQQRTTGQSPTANPNMAVASIAMANALKQGNPAAAAAAAAAAVARGQPGVPGLHPSAQFFPGDGRKLSQEQLNQLMSMNMGMPGSVGMPVTGAGAIPGMGVPPAPGAAGLGVSGAMPIPGAQRPQVTRGMNAAVLQRIQMQQAGANMGAANGVYDARVAQLAQHTDAAAGYSGRNPATASAGGNGSGGGGGGTGVPTGPKPVGADTNEFWEKLEEMKSKYREPLRNMYNFMTIIANSQRPEKKEQFKKHLKDCFQILGLKRGHTQVPPTLTTAVLDTASKFIESVITVYKNYMVSSERNTASGRTSAPSSQVSRPPNAQHALQEQQQNVRAHAGAQTNQDLLKLQGHPASGIGTVGIPMTEATKAAAKAAANDQLRTQQMRVQAQHAKQMAMAGKQDQRGMLLQQRQRMAAAAGHQLTNGYMGRGAVKEQAQRLMMNNVQMQQIAAMQRDSKARQAEAHARQAAALSNRRAGNQAAAPGQPTLQDRVNAMTHIVRQAHDNTLKWEQMIENELKRGKTERIQNTLAALRNVSTAGQKRPTSLVDVHNAPDAYPDDIIRAKPVFECSSDAGLRLAKRPKNDSADLKALRDAVDADCKAAQARNPLLKVELSEEFGQPLVVCQLRIPEIRVPKLILRVQRGYPRKGGATYAFERPPLGWTGILAEIKARFKRAVANAPATSVGVAALLDAWAREADEVIDEQIRSDEEETAALPDIKPQATVV